MVISDIRLENKGWILEGELDYMEESDLFLLGENDGARILIN